MRKRLLLNSQKFPFEYLFKTREYLFKTCERSIPAVGIAKYGPLMEPIRMLQKALLTNLQFCTQFCLVSQERLPGLHVLTQSCGSIAGLTVLCVLFTSCLRWRFVLMIQRPPSSPTYRRSHWLLGYLRMKECGGSGNQLIRKFRLRYV